MKVTAQLMTRTFFTSTDGLKITFTFERFHPKPLFVLEHVLLGIQTRDLGASIGMVKQLN